jgi:hypothetical protein
MKQYYDFEGIEPAFKSFKTWSASKLEPLSPDTEKHFGMDKTRLA